MRELLARNGHELLELITSGDVAAHELYTTQLEFAREVDSKLQSFTAWGPELPASPRLQPGLGSETKPVFSQLPYAAKDLFCTTGLQTTAGSQILSGYQPPYNATIIEQLGAEGNFLLGKTNMDEFAMGSSGETCAYGQARNPWHLDYVPGGSSSGSAAAVAGCQSVMALGTDTGGSVRQPASFCGIVGLRPTYGQLSRSGIIAYSSSCDQASLFTRSTLDAALAMNTLAQRDPLDSTNRPTDGIDFFGEAKRELHWEKLRVGVLREFNDPSRIDKPVLDNFQASLKLLEKAGAQLVDLDFPLVDYCLPAYYIITAAECSSNLARYDGIRYGQTGNGQDLLSRYLSARGTGFGAEVKRRILLGTYVLSTGYSDAYYDRARLLRRDIRHLLDSMFKQVDVLVTPTSPSLAFRFGARQADPVRMYTADLCTVFVNLAGAAGISLPNGFGTESASDDSNIQLPTGIQFVSAPWRDNVLLRVAHNFELLSAWKYKPPDWIRRELGLA